MRCIVVIRAVDDTLDSYGVFRQESAAQAFADSFNRKVTSYEDAHPDEPHGLGWAYVLPLYQPIAREAVIRSGLPRAAR